MKTLRMIGAALVAVVLGAGVCACDDDDDDDVEVSINNIIGSWEVDGGNAWGIDASMSGGSSLLGEAYSYWAKEYMRFYEDGSCVDIQESEYTVGDDVDYDLDVRYGTWTLDGSDLNLRINGISYTYTVKSMTKDKITVSMWGVTAYLVRVSDSVIDAYLEEYDDDDEL